MKQFIRLLRTEFKRIFSNQVLVVIFFGAPLLYGITFVYVYRKGKLTDMPIAVIDSDHSATSAKFIDALDDNESLQVVKVQFDAGQIATEMPSREYVAVIAIPAGFESDIFQKRYPEIMADINTANLVTANFASRAIQTVMGTLSAGIEIEALKKSGMDPETAATRFEPFRVNYSRFYNPSGNYLYLMLPGILGTIMQQVILLGLGLVFARDFEDGYFRKLVAHSRSSFYHIALKATPFILLTALMWIVCGAFFVIYDIDIPVFTSGLAVLVAVFSLACMFLGMLVSLAIPNQLRATELLMVVATPSFLLSGFTWPLEGMPVFIQKIANMLPLTHFLQGFRKLSVYGGSFADIRPQLTALVWIALVCLVLMILLLQWKINRQSKGSRSTAPAHA